MNGKKKFKIGRWLCLFSGAFPIFVGGYRLWELAKNPPDDPWVLALSHVAYANLVMTGIMIVVLALLELPRKSRVAWGLILLGDLWAGGNDTFAVASLYINSNGPFPISIFPLTLGLMGLFLSHGYVFREERAANFWP
jgi:hypothetical protein